MSIHSDCGKEVRWVRRDDDPDRFHPPLEFSGQAYIIAEDNVAMYVTTYKRHECDPDDIKSWYDLKRRQAEALGRDVNELDRREESAIAKERDRNEIWERTLKVDCPTCEVGVANRCHNMSRRKATGEIVFTKNPHPSRIENAWRADGA